MAEEKKLRVLEVAVFGIPETLYYIDELGARIGELVSVEVRGHVARGVVVGEAVERPEGIQIKPILMNEGVWIDEKSLQVARWIAGYYVAHLWEALRRFFPPGALQSEKKLVRVDRRVLKRVDMDRDLTPYEKKVVEKLLRSRGWVRLSGFSSKDRRTIENLVRRGIVRIQEKIQPIRERALTEITSLRVQFDIPERPMGIYSRLLNSISGVTLMVPPANFDRYPLYFYLVKKYMDAGKDVVIIVPDVHAIPYLSRILMDAFGELVGVYHSGFSAESRTAVWMDVFRGKRRVVVGTSMALFLPFRNPGLIIVDDEHDPLYKNEDKRPYFHARDVAVFMGKLWGADVLLYSSTPSMESVFNAGRGKYRMVRIRGRTPVGVKVVDMRRKKFSSPIAPEILDRMRREVGAGNQVIVLINRRGFSRSLMCMDCGYTMMCPNCSVPLFFHKSDGMMHCHICGHRESPVEKCPVCGSLNLRPVGYGTERVQEYLSTIFPGRVVRIDSDVMRRRKQLDEVLSMVYSARASIIVGTNVVARALNLRRVRMAVVLLADLGMMIPDFRSLERIGQVFLQLKGRLSEGTLYIQTFHPESEVMEVLRSEDYMNFARQILRARREYLYPPYYRMTMIEYRHSAKERAELGIQSVYDFLSRRLPDGVELIGPTSPPVEKIRGRYRQRLLLRYKKYGGLSPLLHELVSMDSNIRIVVDPYDFF